jgi:predicted transposase/invertase (TIGR01784 family)
MKHAIDPKIDCVFKAILGAENNSNLLIHFINAILDNDLAAPITQVEILNPYNDKEFLNNKLSIVDVKARDNEGHLYQIEIQLSSYAHLPARILYTWADIYSKQLQKGQPFDLLRPTYSIWLLAKNLLKGDSDYIHSFKIRDNKGRCLSPNCGIWLLELEKFNAQQIENEQQRWLNFFKTGEQLNDQGLPDWMTTNEMRQAMTTLRQFSEKERDYHAYQARQNYLREQGTIEKERDDYQKKAEVFEQKLGEERKEKEAERRAKEKALNTADQALQAKNEALAEIERLKALLAKK